MGITLLDSQCTALAPGQLLARGVCRHLAALNFACMTEFVPTRGLRVDVIAMGPKGEIWVAECKSSRADFVSDTKWQGYLPWCDRFFWAVDAAFPTDLLPDGSGLILTDGYDAEIIAMPDETRLAGARRTALARSFARNAAFRLTTMNDPGIGV